MGSSITKIDNIKLVLKSEKGRGGYNYIKILNEVLDGITDIIGAYKPDHTVLFYNKAGYNFYKKTLQEVKEKKCYEMLGRKQRCLDCYFDKAVKTKKIIEKERYISEINKHVDCCWNPIMDDAGEVMYVVERLRDITEKKVLENTLKENEERYRKIVNLSPEAIVIFLDNKVVLANKQLCKLVGTDYYSIIGKNIYNDMPVDFSKALHKRINNTLKYKKTRDVHDYKCILPYNKIIYLEISLSYLTYKGKSAIQAIVRDVTEMKKGLNRAAEIQNEELQKTSPIPDKIQMESSYVPAKTVSGDFFIFRKISEEFVVGIIADVSGKGITAALSISAFKVLFYEAVSISNEPLKIINILNKKVANYLGERYIAACCFSLDFKNNESKVVGAGINEFIFQKSNEKLKKLVAKGTFLGMFENSVFEEQVIKFKRGDKFYFFTDGLEFVLENDEIKAKNLEKLNITQFTKLMESFSRKILEEAEGIKDDSTLLALEIK